ncbi:MAG: ATP synthase F0 subunit B [Deltaproteobacteria bacterium]|nr:ATP synthase F0 subunit B [Deltaproteobacteria bacterium]
MIRHFLAMLWKGSAVPAAVLFLAGTAAAAEGAGDWRPTYDLIMRWVNFLILAFIIVKYARRPLKNFLADKKTDLEQEIQSLEQEKERIAKEVDQAKKTLEESEGTLSALKARILKEGEAERERIIQEARAQAQVMLESARQRIENQLRRAKGGVVSELVDSAVALALQRLPQMLTPEDHQAWIDRFTTSASQ